VLSPEVGKVYDLNELLLDAFDELRGINTKTGLTDAVNCPVTNIFYYNTPID
jgi:hypothetical protein